MFSCDNVITIPQYKSTCWFNAILMAIFYSQHSRKLLYNHFEDKKDKFSKIMNDIIKHNYIKTEQSIKYFEFMRPENILKYINAQKTELYKQFKTQKNYNYFSDTFLPVFLKSLNKNVLDIIVYEDNCYANFYSTLPPFFTKIYKDDETVNIDFDKWCGIESKDITDPDYIIVNKLTPDSDTSLSLYREIFLLEYYNSYNLESINLQTLGTDTDIKGVIDLNDEIYHNGNKYVLDSVILTNYNSFEIDKGHEIAGITCKNNRYVYNGWIRTTNDSGMPMDFGNEKLPCELMKFHWNVKEDNKFCLNRRLCKLDKYDESKKGEMCFTFNDNNYTALIYVKDTSSIKSIDTNLSISSSLTLPSLKSNSSLTDDEIELIQRREKQSKYKQTSKKQQITLSFTKFNYNYYFMNKSDTIIIKNPDIILIYNIPFDYLGISYIKELEYLLNIHNYNNITLKEFYNNTLTYNDYNYQLIEDNNNIRTYKLIEKKTQKQYLEQLPILKTIKNFNTANTKEEFLNFKRLNIATEQYLEEISNILRIQDEVFRFEAQALPTIATENNSYIDCILIAFFNNKNPKIEELFFKNQIKNKYAIEIIDEFKSYYETKTYNKTKLLKAIQMYYNEFINQNPEYPKIAWAKGKYYFIDLIILLQHIFNFKKNKIHILLSYKEKSKIITKKRITPTTEITKLKPNPQPEIKSLKLQKVIVRLKDKYRCLDNTNKYYKTVGYIYF